MALEDRNFDSPLAKAEAHLRADEEAGIIRQTPEARASAKLALAESFEKQERQETSVSGASVAFEGGNTIVSAGGERSLQEIDDQLARLRQGPRNAETQAKIQALNNAKDLIRQPSGDDIDVLMSR